MVQPVNSDARFSLTSGVLPMVSMKSLRICMMSFCDVTATGNH
jgi:hypothetical protein